MREPEPADVCLPTTEQIVMASERAILATLDVTLLMAERTLRAEHVSLGDESNAEPNPPHLAIAGSILILAESLRALIQSYRAETDRVLGDG